MPSLGRVSTWRYDGEGVVIKWGYNHELSHIRGIQGVRDYFGNG